MDLYDCSLGVIRVGPYHYQPLRGVDLWLQQVIIGFIKREFSIQSAFLFLRRMSSSCLNFLRRRKSSCLISPAKSARHWSTCAIIRFLLWRFFKTIGRDISDVMILEHGCQCDIKCPLQSMSIILDECLRKWTDCHLDGRFTFQCVNVCHSFPKMKQLFIFKQKGYVGQRPRSATVLRAVKFIVGFALSEKNKKHLAFYTFVTLCI